MSGAGRMGWWRRNWWAMAAVAPLLVAMVLVSPDDSYRTWRQERAEGNEAILPGADGWASNGDARVRLVGFGIANELVDRDGQPFRLPGLRVWRATIVIEPIDPEAEPFCLLSLVDDADRRFLPRPDALSGARTADGSVLQVPSCSPPLAATDAPAPVETVGWFLLPESATPVALRVRLSDLADAEQRPVDVRLAIG